jgi:pyruvate dehydrogenase E1 component alpha subunit
LYETAFTIRTCDDTILQLIRSGQVEMTYYSPRGHESIAAALGSQLTHDDYLVTTYRGIHHQIAKGVPLDTLIAEFLGRSTGTCGGKGGPMHITYPAVGLMVTTGIVGAGLPIANGLALASKLRGEERVTAVTFGDGASNIGAFHEALNLASIWQLPVVFVCENNGYGEHTRYDRTTAVDSIALRSKSYNMPGVAVDGHDPIAMSDVIAEAAHRARNHGGPTLIEAKTYRLGGHDHADPAQYIPREERKSIMLKDPLPLLRSRISESGLEAENALSEIETRVAGIVSAAATFALESPLPSVDTLLDNVFSAAVTA